MKGATGTQVLVGIGAAAVATCVIVGLVIIDSPGETRARRFDEQRESDLREIADAVNDHWEQNESLPTSLAELSQQTWNALNTKDPVTGDVYGYRILDDENFELCAGFSRESKEPRRGVSGSFWTHPAGRHCFEIEVREDDPPGQIGVR